MVQNMEKNRVIRQSEGEGTVKSQPHKGDNHKCNQKYSSKEGKQLCEMSRQEGAGGGWTFQHYPCRAAKGLRLGVAVKRDSSVPTFKKENIFMHFV